MTGNIDYGTDNNISFGYLDREMDISRAGASGGGSFVYKDGDYLLIGIHI